MKKYIVSCFLSLFLVGCKSSYLLTQENKASPLASSEGYLGLVINSLDRLNDIKIQKESGEYFYVGSAIKGNTVKLLKLPEGEYCFSGFDVYDLRVTYTDQGFCTYVEADELNYFATFVVRNPVTTSHNNFRLFTKMLNKEFPSICSEYIGENCKK